MTFAVEPGSVTGFLGPNGAGKTTTMRAIFGLTALDAGEVPLGGAARRPTARRTFGYLPEERGLYPSMKVLEQLRYLGQLRGIPGRSRRRGRPLARPSWASATGPDDELEDLSLGNQQRVQLIGALLHRPDVLVLDEPFSGLDPVAVDALSKVLVGEARRGATVLFSSHQLDLVEDLCERAVVVDRGRVVAEGTIDELTAGADPVLEVDVPSDPDGRGPRSLDGARAGDRQRAAGGCACARAGPGHGRRAGAVVLDAARRAGPVSHFAFERRSLAEVFLGMVGRPGGERRRRRRPKVARDSSARARRPP